MNGNNKRFDWSRIADSIQIEPEPKSQRVQGPELFSHESVLTSPRFVTQKDQSLEPESLSLECSGSFFVCCFRGK